MKINSLKELHGSKINDLKERLDGFEQGELRKQDKTFKLKAIFISSGVSLVFGIVSTLLAQYLIKLFIK